MAAGDTLWQPYRNEVIQFMQIIMKREGMTQNEIHTNRGFMFYIIVIGFLKRVRQQIGQ